VPAGQKLGVGLLVTALTHLHVRNLARENSLEAGSVAAGDEQLGSCAAGKRRHSASCIQWQVNPRGD